MYDGRWHKNIKKISFPVERPTFEPGPNDLAVIELAEAIEPEYVKPACFAYKMGLRNYSGDLLVSQRQICL